MTSIGPHRKLRTADQGCRRQAAHIRSLSAQLQSSRKAYLSTARTPVSRLSSARHLTDAQRDALDAETKAIIRSTLSLIDRLESAEKIRVQTEARLFKKKHSTLRSIWEDEGVREADAAAMNIVTAHREGILWFLKNRLEKASEEQRGRQEIRLNRQIEREKSLLHNVPLRAPKRVTAAVPTSEFGSSQVAVEEEADRQAIQAFSPDQLRIFEKENDGMLKHYEDTLEQVRCVSLRLIEQISS